MSDRNPSSARLNAGQPPPPPPPPLPPQPLTSGLHGYNPAPLGYPGGPYSAPYSRFGPGYSGYGAGYGAGYGGPYGAYPAAVGSGEVTLARLAEERASRAFRGLDSVVQAVSSVSLLLQSSSDAVQSSFRAVVGTHTSFHQPLTCLEA